MNLRVRGLWAIEKKLFYVKFYTDFYANFTAISLFWLILIVTFMLILKTGFLFCLIISMISRGTLELQYSCSAWLMFDLLIVLWLLQSLLTRHRKTHKDQRVHISIFLGKIVVLGTRLLGPRVNLDLDSYLPRAFRSNSTQNMEH